MNYMGNSLIPMIVLAIVVYGMFKGRKVYEWFVEGAKEGLDVCIRIFPALLAMIVAVRIFKDANMIEYINNLLTPILNLIGMPAEVMPLAMIKPLSGSGALGVFTDILNTVGPDSRTGMIASVLMGTTETIFYTITVYFGAVGIKNIRHTIWATTFADLVSIILSIIMVSYMFF
ncbi:spore maturation protein [uncultured Clostridium sp.]|uniref:spore maturation protein n=1 Tax=uncultured Clostridium sp. TaxID=59620 RepID=UPI002634407B|nr:nucleoside recognition domain-containing protein [uncultured Clostridium sp.]